jgi:acyl-[acyl-carrier-protein]-phospholipid O-acyltransferase/long-chain-fatty-acid--[acyl-carrier-protein] ligase
MILHHVFIDNVKKNPQKIAVIEHATGKEVSYEYLLVAALVFRDVFQKYSSRHIGIMIPPSPGCIIAMLGAIFAGKIPVMINYSTGARENSLYAQKKCAFRTIITSKKLIEKLCIAPVRDMVYMEDLAEKVTLYQRLKNKFLSKLPAEHLKKMLPPVNADDNIMILFTSGSEKDPRAVQLSHKNIAHNIINIQKVLNLADSDIFITNLPYFHVFGLTVNLWIPLALSAKIITTPNPLDYKVVVECVKRHSVTLFVATPTFHLGYLQRSEPGDFESVRICVSGADKMPNHLREEYKKIHNIEILEGYGTTETSPIVSVNLPEGIKLGSVGKPLPGVQVKVIHLETGDEVPRGEEGKILVKGDLVMRGYYNDIEETSYRIRDGWYDTGDMGVHDPDGYLHHRGRLRRFVKIGGEMVSLVKVEDELIKIFSDDTVCCVVDIPDPVKGAEIVAVVTSREINQNQVKKLLAQVLPPVAIPKKFHVLPEIPFLPNGKVNLRAVEEICRNIEME